MHTYLYKAVDGLGPLNEWTATELAELAEPVGSMDAVKVSLGCLFENLRWQQIGDTWCAGHATCQSPYIDIMLREDARGQCRFIVFNKPDRSILRRVMQSFGFNYACTPENGKLLTVQG
jgi:hypothetical protein